MTSLRITGEYGRMVGTRKGPRGAGTPGGMADAYTGGIDMTKPTPLTKRLRYEVLRRDGFACRYCGAKAPEVELQVDHVVPAVLGGPTEPSNLVAACIDCNQGKSSVPPDAETVEDVELEMLRWSATVRRAGYKLVNEWRAHASYVEAFQNAWSSWVSTYDEKPFPLPADWRNSVAQLAERGLPVEMAVSAIEITMRKEGIPHYARFRYWCGVANNKLGKVHELAREMMGDFDGS